MVVLYLFDRSQTSPRQYVHKKSKITKSEQEVIFTENIEEAKTYKTDRGAYIATKRLGYQGGQYSSWGTDFVFESIEVLKANK